MLLVSFWIGGARWQTSNGQSSTHLGNPLEAAVPRAKVDVGGPVVGKVLRVGAARAGRQLGRVVLDGRHGRVERVAADDLVHVRRRPLARVDQGVEAVHHELRAPEAHELLADDAMESRRGGDERAKQHGLYGLLFCRWRCEMSWGAGLQATRGLGAV